MLQLQLGRRGGEGQFPSIGSDDPPPPPPGVENVKIRENSEKKLGDNLF